MKRKKRICLSAVFLSILLYAAAAFASDQNAVKEPDTEELTTEASVSEEGTEEESITEENASGTEIIEGVTVEDVTEFLEGIDYEELEKNLKAILAMVQSEDFQSLMSYQEMQDLVIVAMDRIETFALEDPELVAKICVALGLQEKFASLIPSLIREYDYSREDLEVLLTGDESKERRSVALILLQHPEIATLVSEILETFIKAAS